MFVYLAREGRYWLRGAVLSFIFALSISGVLPLAAGFVPGTSGLVAEAQAKNEVPGVTCDPGPSAPSSFGQVLPPCEGKKSTSANNNDKKPKTYGLSMDPAQPSGQAIVAGNELSREVFKPWVSESMPWDANWGAFNSNISERLGGTCVLDEQDQKSWSAFLAEMERRQKKITSTGPAAAKDFQRQLKQAMTGDAPGAGIARTLLADTKVAGGLGGYDELLQLASTSPELAGCNRSNGVLGAWAEGFVPNPLNIFKQPGRFIAQLVFFLPAMIGYGIFQAVAPFAFGLALNTPHSERGDNLTNSFSVTAASGAATTSQAQALGKEQGSGKASENMGDMAVQQDCVSNNGTTSNADRDLTYSGDAQLGIKCENLNPENQSSNAWIQMANALRSALSAVYGIIVIAVALLYMFRRNAQSQYHIKVILPRLFLAVVMTMAAPFVIGALITFSNWMVQAIFQSVPGSVPQQLMQAVASLTVLNYQEQFGAAIISMAVPTLILILMDVVAIYLILIAVGKQLLLIALIVTCPIACLAFVFRDHGKNLFSFWTKGLLAVVFLPVALAAVLAGGLTLVRAFWDPGSSLAGADLSWSFADIGMRYVAALILVATLIGMIKVVGAVRQWATGNKVGMIGKMGGTATKLGGTAVAAAGLASGNPMAAAAGRQISSMASSAGSAMQRGSQRGGWIPQSGSTMGGAASRRGGGNMLGAGTSKLNEWGREREQVKRDHAKDRSRKAREALEGRGGQGAAPGGPPAVPSTSSSAATSAPVLPSAGSKIGSNFEQHDSGLVVPPGVVEPEKENPYKDDLSAGGVYKAMRHEGSVRLSNVRENSALKGVGRIVKQGRVFNDTGSFSKDKGIAGNMGVAAKKNLNFLTMTSNPFGAGNHFYQRFKGSGSKAAAAASVGK